MTYRSMRIDGRHHVIVDCGSFDTAKEAHDCVEWLNELERQAEPLVSLERAVRLLNEEVVDAPSDFHSPRLP